MVSTQELIRKMRIKRKQFDQSVMPILRSERLVYEYSVGPDLVPDKVAQALILFSQTKEAHQRWDEVVLPIHSFAFLPVNCSGHTMGVSTINLQVNRCNYCYRIWHMSTAEIVKVYKESPDLNMSNFSQMCVYAYPQYESKSPCDKCKVELV